MFLAVIVEKQHTTPCWTRTHATLLCNPEKLDEILGKLNKLDSIESTLNILCSKMAIVEGDISKLKADARGTDTKLQQMHEGLKWFNNEMEDIKLKMKFLEAVKEDLHTKQLYAEACSRREPRI